MAQQKAWPALQEGHQNSSMGWRQKGDRITVRGEGGMASTCWKKTHLTGGEHFFLHFPSTLMHRLSLPQFPVAQALSRAGACTQCQKVPKGTGHLLPGDLRGERRHFEGPHASPLASAMKQPKRPPPRSLPLRRAADCPLRGGEEHFTSSLLTRAVLCWGLGTAPHKLFRNGVSEQAEDSTWQVHTFLGCHTIHSPVRSYILWGAQWPSHNFISWVSEQWSL